MNRNKPACQNDTPLLLIKLCTYIKGTLFQVKLPLSLWISLFRSLLFLFAIIPVLTGAHCSQSNYLLYHHEFVLNTATHLR